jgi:hypothetical protein
MNYEALTLTETDNNTQMMTIMTWSIWINVITSTEFYIICDHTNRLNLSLLNIIGCLYQLKCFSNLNLPTTGDESSLISMICRSE